MTNGRDIPQGKSLGDLGREASWFLTHTLIAVLMLAIVIVAVSALVLANIVAALPGRTAAQTSSAQVLRGE